VGLVSIERQLLATIAVRVVFDRLETALVDASALDSAAGAASISAALAACIALRDLDPWYRETPRELANRLGPSYTEPSLRHLDRNWVERPSIGFQQRLKGPFGQRR